MRSKKGFFFCKDKNVFCFLKNQNLRRGKVEMACLKKKGFFFKI